MRYNRSKTSELVNYLSPCRCRSYTIPHLSAMEKLYDCHVIALIAISMDMDKSYASNLNGFRSI
jgi:hypothetical protein